MLRSIVKETTALSILLIELNGLTWTLGHLCIEQDWPNCFNAGLASNIVALVTTICAYAQAPDMVPVSEGKQGL